MMTTTAIDIVDVLRVESLMIRGGERFLRRWFTETEIAYCTAKAFPSRHFAARLAAKEAVVKILPAGWDGPLVWREIAIVNDGNGAPRVELSGAPLEVAHNSGRREITVSMSHTDSYATAVALAHVDKEWPHGP